MGDRTSIEWCDATFNPWWGCTEVGPGCDNCYARMLARRKSVKWGPLAARALASDRVWSQPRAWNAKAKKDGKRLRVFCASMADVFDNEAPQAWRERLWTTILATPQLDWLLLTKRIGNVARMIPTDWVTLPQNIWLGISVVNQEEADRDIPKLISMPARVRFLSCEPLLGPIDFAGRWIEHANPAVHENVLERLDWVIVGGESGPHARPFNIEWARSIVAQCRAIGTAPFVKQLGANPMLQRTSSSTTTGPGFRLSVSECSIDTDILLSDSKGGDWSEWEADLRVREFPSAEVRP